MLAYICIQIVNIFVFFTQLKLWVAVASDTQFQKGIFFLFSALSAGGPTLDVRI